MEFGPMVGVSDPPSAQAFKRGVLKSAPHDFSVEVLPPAKHGGAYSYGLRVCPTSLRSDSRSVRSDRSWNTEYEIWRRWEDCLHFQEVLENEYAQMSREKRKRLKSGKGIKKDGVYKTSDFAASFDSLPAGPDHRDIATDVHDYLPKLNKKGTLFRPTPSAVAQRGQEFAAIINALWQEDPPTLIRELREQMRVRDFFGFWRRDEDRLRKSGLSGPVLNSALYGTASHSAVSLVPTTSGMSVRSSFMSPMFLRLRGNDDVSSPGGQTTFSDDAFSIMSVPPYSPPPPSLPPKSPSRRRRSSHSGTPPTPATPQQSAQLTSDSASIALVFEPSDVLTDDGDDGVFSTQQQQHSSLAPSSPPPASSARSPIGYPAQQSPLPPPRSVQAAQGQLPASPTSPLSVISRPPRRTSMASPSSRANRNCRIFGAPPSSPDEEQHGDPQFVILPGMIEDGSDRESCAPSSPSLSQIKTNRNSAIRINIGSSSSPNNVSPPHSATNSVDSASSGGAVPSVFTESDSSSSSRRSSWETSASASKAQPLNKGKEKEVVEPVEVLASEVEQTRPNARKANAPVSFRDPIQTEVREGFRNSASSLDTLQNIPASHRNGSSEMSHSQTSYDRRSPMLQRAKRPPPSLISSPESRWDATPSPHDSIDVLDSYFDNISIIKSEHTGDLDDRPTSAHSSVAPSFISKSEESMHSRESIHFQPPTPDRFPAPFQHRPPGQFHLPWSPTHPHQTPPYDGFFPVTHSKSQPPASTPNGTFAIKAMYDDAIVVLKVDRSMSLHEIRHRIHEKFVKQENIPLGRDFVLSYKNPRMAPRPGLRARSNSTSTVSTISTISTISSLSKIDPSQLSFLILDKEWKDLASNCGPKLTLIVLDS